MRRRPANRGAPGRSRTMWRCSRIPRLLKRFLVPPRFSSSGSWRSANCNWLHRRLTAGACGALPPHEVAGGQPARYAQPEEEGQVDQEVLNGVQAQMVRNSIVNVPEKQIER